MARRTRFGWAASLALVVLAACSRGEASRAAGDRSLVDRIVEQDQRASKGMHAVDEAARRGASGAALDLIDTEVRPAIDEGLRLADAARPESPWGRETIATLAAILRDRRAELPRYGTAVTDAEPDELLAAIEAQAAIERRALAVVATMPGSR